MVAPVDTVTARAPTPRCCRRSTSRAPVVIWCRPFHFVDALWRRPAPLLTLRTASADAHARSRHTFVGGLAVLLRRHGSGHESVRSWALSPPGQLQGRAGAASLLQRRPGPLCWWLRAAAAGRLAIITLSLWVVYELPLKGGADWGAKCRFRRCFRNFVRGGSTPCCARFP